MPLSKRQFELGVDEEGENLMIQVYELLVANPDLAYSHEELQQSVLGTPIPVTRLGKLNRAVEALVGIGAIDERVVSGTNYYAFLQEFDTGTWKSVKLRSF